MSIEHRSSGRTPEREKENLSRRDVVVGLGTAVGLLLAVGPLLEKADQQAIRGAQVLANRVGAAMVISLAATGTAYLSSRIRKR